MTDSATNEISVAAAADLLGTTGQTVRNYIHAGRLSARRAGKRSFQIERSSVEALMRQGGVGTAHRWRTRTASAPDDAETLARERDDLRARVVELQESVLRLRAAASLQRQADDERAAEIEHLVEALQAAERADDLRRRAAAELEEALAGKAVPGHPGEIAGS